MNAKTTFKSQKQAETLAAPTDKASVEYWHATQPGFGVRVMRKSTKGLVRRTYLCRYKDEDGNDKKEPLGTVTELKYDDALDIARAKLKQVAARKRGVYDPIYGEAVEQYMKEISGDVAPRTLETYRECLEKLNPLLGKMTISEITPKIVTDYLVENKGKRGYVAAQNAMRTFSIMCNRLIADKVITENPVTPARKKKLMKAPDPRQTHVPRKQLAEFWKALNEVTNPGPRDYILWELFTGFRRSLTGNLAWSRVDVDERTYYVHPDDEGNKSKKALQFPIPDFLWETVIEPRLKTRKPGDKWILVSRTTRFDEPKPVTDVRDTFAEIVKHCSVKIHDHAIRRTFASIAEVATGNGILTSRMLMHSVSENVSKVTSDYVILADDDMRAGVNIIAEKILELCEYTKAPEEIPEAA